MMRRRRLRLASLSACVSIGVLLVWLLVARNPDDWDELPSHAFPELSASERSARDRPWRSVNFNPYARRGVMNVSFDRMYNAVEDIQLQCYIGSQGHRVRGVILFVANTARVSRLTNSLRRLNAYFNRKFRYPIVIFHEADFLPFTEPVRRAGFIPELGLLPIFFQQVDLSSPGWLSKKYGRSPQKSCNIGDLKHRSVCRFQAKLMHEQSVMRHFDYYWRLDDDTGITAPIHTDLFEDLVGGGFSYGFAESGRDECSQNLYSVTADYMKARDIKATFFHRLKKDDIARSGFVVSSMKFWLSKQYHDYIEYIDNLGGIYMYRWGDTPIKTLALSMHVPLRELHRFTNISFSHCADENWSFS